MVVMVMMVVVVVMRLLLLLLVLVVRCFIGKGRSDDTVVEWTGRTVVSVNERVVRTVSSPSTLVLMQPAQRRQLSTHDASLQ